MTDYCPPGYTLEREIARGGFGVVWEVAPTTAPERRLALKYPLPTANDEDLQRFQREVKLQSQLSHPNVQPIVHFDSDNSPPWFVSPLAKQNLGSYLEKKNLAPEAALTLYAEVLEGVAYAHRNRVLHRDLKPQNVLIFKLPGSVTTARVTDFGLGRPFTRGSSYATATGQAFGTPWFAPPEQWSHFRDVGPSADVFSLGRILQLVLHLILQQGVDKYEGLQYLVSRATAEEPNDRYPEVEDMISDFQILSMEPDALKRPIDEAVQLIRAAASGEAVSRNLESLVNLLVRNGGDYSLLVGILARIPSNLLDQLINQYGPQMREVVKAYGKAIDDPLPLDAAIVGARFLDQCLESSAEWQLRSSALRSLVSLGARYPVWEVNSIAMHRVYTEPHHSVILDLAGEFRRNASVREWGIKHLDRRLLPEVLRREMVGN